MAKYNHDKNTDMQEIINSLMHNQSNKSDSESFYSESIFNKEDCSVEVSGIGKINFPVSKTDIQKLIESSSQAKFGLREKTLLDKEVRDTREIEAEQLTVQFNEQKFDTMLDDIRSAIGLPEDTKLTASLHNMLIYGQGQFFKNHQDSEKLEGMVATLVVVLPSAHIGGDLLINHHKEKHRFVSENIDQQQLQCVAFYADCHHEIKQVTQGHRIALTFNLVLENNNAIIDDNTNKDLDKALQNYFAEDKDPCTLVYLLDHEYTEHSLRWNMLKSGDSNNASEFLSAAKRLGLVAHLTLIDLRQSWTTEVEYGDEEPHLGEIFDEEQHLYCWVDKSNKKLPYREYSISTDELCLPAELITLEPSSSAYEGWMGNYGHTMDYWYKKAAIVLWPEENQLCMSFNLGYQSQLEALIKLTENPGNEQQVKDIINKAGKYLIRNHNYRETSYQTEAYKKLFEIAYYVNDESTASSLVGHFKLTDIKEIHADIMAQLQKRYDTSWCLELLTRWQDNIKGSYSNNDLLDNIDDLLRKLLAKGGDISLAEFLLQHQFDSLVRCYKNTAETKPKYIQESQAARTAYVQDLFKACIHALPNDNLTQKLVAYLINNPVVYPVFSLTEIISSIATPVITTHRSAYDNLLNHAIEIASKQIAQGVRENDDWSIEQKLLCPCDYCKEATLFLASNNTQKIWPIAMATRKHIAESFCGMCIPVTLETVKQGSPHKLILTKSNKIHQDAKDNFEKLKNCYNKLIEDQVDLIK